MSALDIFFDARSIAVIGASTHPLKVGHQVLRNLVGSKKSLYPIHPDEKSILGMPVFANISSVSEPIDIVVIATPAITVPGLIDEICQRNEKFAENKRVRGIILITAGFAESGAAGNTIQKELMEKLRLANIQLLGPNTLGLLRPHQNINASFAQREVYDGCLGVISQSGAILTALFDTLAQKKLGVSFAVSLGNAAGITENECLEYAFTDTRTEVVLLYLESFSDLPTFFEVVSKIRQKKPVVVLKGGVSERGQKASASHTAALATNQVLLAAAAEQIGFTLLNTLEEFLQVATFFSQFRRVPDNVMVLTNAGGPAVNTIDELQKNHVQLAEWGKRAIADLDDCLPNIPPHNPLDLLGDATPERFRLALQIAQHDIAIDAVLIIITPQAVTDIPGIIEEILKSRGRMAMFVSLVGGEQLEKYRQKLRDHGIFANDYPNQSVEILSTMQKILRLHHGGKNFSSLAKKSQARVLPTPLPNLDQTFQLIHKYGFRLPKSAIVHTASRREFASLPYPLFVKTANPSLLHKKEVGAVFGVVRSPVEAAEAYAKLAQFGNDVLFQELLDIDFEVLLGVEKDPQFGWYMSVGLGGSISNILGDRQYIFLSASMTEMEAAWKKTKAAAGLRTNPKASQKIVELMMGLQELVREHPWVRSLEINPLAVNEKGVWAADVKVGV